MTEINVSKKSLAGQITLADVVEPPKKSPMINDVAKVLTVVAAFLLGVGVTQCNRHNNKPLVNCYDCHRKVAFTHYFKKAGSPTPERMADAVLNTENPRLLASISKVESGGNPHIRNSGYKKRHHGAFQVNPRHWGKVPHDALDQALQAQAILVELTQTMPIEKALSLYGGDSTSRYQKRVLAELREVP